MARIAVIGTGISGMSAAYLLLRAGHEVTIYEKEARIGGHTRTLRINYDGSLIDVDTGFIVFNYQNYPQLTGMFKHLGVGVRKSDMTLAVTINNGAFEWGAKNLNAVFGQRRNIISPTFYTMIGDVRRFNRHALAMVEQQPTLSLGDLLQLLGCGEDFKNYYLLPMGGAIWSCPPSSMLAFPARQFVQFFKNHGLLSFTGQHQWYTVTDGSQRYVEKLTASISDRIKTGCAAVKVLRGNNTVSVSDVQGQTAMYDHVVFACHADETLAILHDANPQEHTILGAFTYQKNIAYLHRDISFMPKRRVCWSSWVYHADSQPGKEINIGVTYWMNNLQAIDANKPLFVTLNPTREIPPAMIFDRHVFMHPVFTNQTALAQQRLPDIQGKQNTWFCGAYTRHGFHEDGLMSAVLVADRLGADIPWC